MPATSINTLTRDEILALMPDESIICPTCGKHFIRKRSWQKYCSDRCRTTAFSTSITELQAQLLVERRDHLAERDKLVQEVAALQHEVDRLRLLCAAT